MSRTGRTAGGTRTPAGERSIGERPSNRRGEPVTGVPTDLSVGSHWGLRTERRWLRKRLSAFLCLSYRLTEGIRPVAKTQTVKADTTGRLTLPASLCKALGIEPGDTFVVAAEEQGIVLRPMQRENPFDARAEHALAEYRAGRTQNLRDFATDQGIDLDG